MKTAMGDGRWVMAVLGAVALAGATWGQYRNDIRGSWSASATAATAIVLPTNGVNIAEFVLCNTGAFRVALWRGNPTSITFNAQTRLMETNVDWSVTNINAGGTILQATNGYLTITYDSTSDNQRTVYAHGIGGTALGTVTRTPRQ